MTNDKDLERQYRKNLMVVASIVLIYSIAGGKMAPDLSLFGAKLQFSRPDWLEYAMVTVMCFFWWRHWQVSGCLRFSSREIAYNTLIMPEVITQKLYKNGSSGGGAEFVAYHGAHRVKERINNDDYSPVEITEMYLHWFWSRAFGSYFNVIVYTVEYDQRRKPISSKELTISDFTDKALILICYAWAVVKSAWNRPEFGDAILPSLTTIAALLAYCGQKLA